MNYNHINNVPSSFSGIAFINSSKHWFLDGELHREDGPAIEHNNGSKDWFYYGLRHRENEPAIETIYGRKEWWLEGKRHRTDGPAVELADGTKEWWINDVRHREDGSAVEYPDGGKSWYVNGKRHREDGPAVEYPDGRIYYYLDDLDLAISKEVFEKKVLRLKKIANAKSCKEKSILQISIKDLKDNFTGVVSFYEDLSVCYYLNGKLHREDGPAIKHMNGDKEWFINGKCHREDGPAVENVNGNKYWYLNGIHHRVDGPAIEYSNGDKEWWLNGKLHREDGPAIDGQHKYYFINGIEYSKEDYYNNIVDKKISKIRCNNGNKKETILELSKCMTNIFSDSSADTIFDSINEPEIHESEIVFDLNQSHCIKKYNKIDMAIEEVFKVKVSCERRLSCDVILSNIISYKDNNFMIYDYIVASFTNDKLIYHMDDDSLVKLDDNLFLCLRDLKEEIKEYIRNYFNK